MFLSKIRSVSHLGRPIRNSALSISRFSDDCGKLSVIKDKPGEEKKEKVKYDLVKLQSIEIEVPLESNSSGHIDLVDVLRDLEKVEALQLDFQLNVVNENEEFSRSLTGIAIVDLMETLPKTAETPRGTILTTPSIKLKGERSRSSGAKPQITVKLTRTVQKRLEEQVLKATRSAIQAKIDTGSTPRTPRIPIGATKSSDKAEHKKPGEDVSKSTKSQFTPTTTPGATDVFKSQFTPDTTKTPGAIKPDEPKKLGEDVLKSKLTPSTSSTTPSTSKLDKVEPKKPGEDILKSKLTPSTSSTTPGAIKPDEPKKPAEDVLKSKLTPSNSSTTPSTPKLDKVELKKPGEDVWKSKLTPSTSSTTPSTSKLDKVELKKTGEDVTKSIKSQFTSNTPTMANTIKPGENISKPTKSQSTTPNIFSTIKSDKVEQKKSSEDASKSTKSQAIHNTSTIPSAIKPVDDVLKSTKPQGTPNIFGTMKSDKVEQKSQESESKLTSSKKIDEALSKPLFPQVASSTPGSLGAAKLDKVDTKVSDPNISKSTSCQATPRTPSFIKSDKMEQKKTGEDVLKSTTSQLTSAKFDKADHKKPTESIVKSMQTKPTPNTAGTPGVSTMEKADQKKSFSDVLKSTPSQATATIDSAIKLEQKVEDVSKSVKSHFTSSTTVTSGTTKVEKIEPKKSNLNNQPTSSPISLEKVDQKKSDGKAPNSARTVVISSCPESKKVNVMSEVKQTKSTKSDFDSKEVKKDVAKGSLAITPPVKSAEQKKAVEFPASATKPIESKEPPKKTTSAPLPATKPIEPREPSKKAASPATKPAEPKRADSKDPPTVKPAEPKQARSKETTITTPAPSMEVALPKKPEESTGTHRRPALSSLTMRALFISLKLLTFGSAIYWTSNQGVWGPAEDAENFWRRWATRIYPLMLNRAGDPAKYVEGGKKVDEYENETNSSDR